LKRRIKPYKKVDKISLYLADCITAMNVILNTESVDVVVTSPPYNIGVDYHTYDGSLPREKYLRRIRDVCAAIRRILKPNGSFFLNIGTKPTIPSLPFEVALCLERV
jgi:site-specific DNA-methyltransferase (adenine-specific)